MSTNMEDGEPKVNEPKINEEGFGDLSHPEIVLDSHNSKVTIYRRYFDKTRCQKIFDACKDLKWVQSGPKYSYLCGGCGDVNESLGTRLTNNIMILPVFDTMVALQKQFKHFKNEDEGLCYFLKCLLNDYREKECYIPYHRDVFVKDGKTVPCSLVLTLSLGITRTMKLRRLDRRNGIKVQFNLNDGDLLIMSGDCQDQFQHKICPGLEHGRRISLTFRKQLTSKKQ